MQGFLDRRTEALKAIDALLDALGDDEEEDWDGSEGTAHDEASDPHVTPSAGAWSGAPHGRDAYTPHGSASRIPMGDGGVAALLSRITLLNGESGECVHGGDPEADLPSLVAVPGYVRGRDGIWRYSDGGVVPGARDDTLGRRYRFASRPGKLVLVPVELCHRRDLLWVKDHHNGDPGAGTTWWGRTVPAYAIGRSCWNERASVPLGITAPELAPSSLLDLSAVAAALGVRESTVSAYKARGRLPQPQFCVSNSPMWSWVVIDRWIRSRGLLDPGSSKNPGKRKGR